MLVLSSSTFVWSQKVNLDSLKIQTAYLKGESLVKTYLEIAELSLNKFGQVDSLISYSTLAYQESNKIKYVEGKFNSLLSISLGYARNNDIESSNKILLNLLEEKTEIEDDKLLADVYFKLGFNAYLTNDLDESMNYFLEASEIYNSINDYENLALTYCRIAAIFSIEGQIDKCIYYLNEALILVPKIESRFSQLSVYSTASGQFIQVGQEKKEYLDSSIYYGEKALNIVLQDEFYSKGSQLCNSISSAYNYQGKPGEALSYLKLATQFSPFLYPSEAIITYFNLSDFYYSSEQFPEALIYLDSIFYILKNFDDPYYEMIAFERVYAINRDAGNFEKSLYGLEKYNQWKDSLYTIEQNKNINDISEKYQTELKDAEIKSLNQKNELDDLKILLLIVAIALALLIIVLILIFFRQRILKQRKIMHETEERLNRARMNPHFFFNALTSIQSLALKEGKSEEVAFYISKLSKLMRQSLESTFNDSVSLDEELAFITKYLEIQKFYLDDKFDFNISIHNDLNPEQLIVPTMLIQPFLENSIEHGFKRMKTNGEILIEIKKSNTELVIIISDNGESLSENNLSKEFPSRATQIIRDRLFLLNKKHRSLSSYKLEKRTVGKGMIATIYLPYMES